MMNEDECGTATLTLKKTNFFSEKQSGPDSHATTNDLSLSLLRAQQHILQSFTAFFYYWWTLKVTLKFRKAEAEEQTTDRMTNHAIQTLMGKCLCC